MKSKNVSIKVKSKLDKNNIRHIVHNIQKDKYVYFLIIKKYKLYTKKKCDFGKIYLNLWARPQCERGLYL